MRLGLGLAALGRPGYITTGHDRDLPDRSVDGLRARSHVMLDAAWSAGIRFIDVARGYGLAESFVGSWLALHPERRTALTIESKWGYAYTAGWQVAAPQHERKDHSLGMFERQWEESLEALGTTPDVYLVHSLTPESTALEDRVLLDRLEEVAGCGVRVGCSTSGPRQAELIDRLLRIGTPFQAVQVTCNLLERSAATAIRRAADAGWMVVVKEALANGAVLELAELPTLVAPAAPATAATAAALAIDEHVIVLSGAVTEQQLAGHVAAVDVDGAAIWDATAGLASAPDDYWSARSTRAWR